MRHRNDIPLQPLGFMDGEDLHSIVLALDFSRGQPVFFGMRRLQVFDQRFRGCGSDAGEIANDIRKPIQVAGADRLIRVAMPARQHLMPHSQHLLDVRDQVRQVLAEAVAPQIPQLPTEQLQPLGAFG